MKPTFLAAGIASAMLAGEWAEAAMCKRVAHALALEVRPPWIRTLVRFARKQFSEPPRDARDLLAFWLVASDAWPRVLAARVRVRRFVVDQPEMRRTRFVVPTIETPGDLAAFLGIDVRTMDALADARRLSRFAPHERMRHYRYRIVPKPNGGERVIEIPKRRLKGVQRDILARVLADVPPHGCAIGFRRGRSVVDFARPHARRDVVVRVDLSSFFQNVSARRVDAIFRAIGYPEAVARTLTGLTTHAVPRDVSAALGFDDRMRLAVPHLPQGAPTSPMLANLVAYGLDVRLDALARKLGATYTRYADDLVFSGDEELARAADALVVEMMAIAMGEGFVVNARKTRIQRRSVRQCVGGLVVNDRPRWRRAERERFEAILVNCARRGVETQNRANVPDFRAHLAGRLAWLAQVDPAEAAKMRPLFDAIRWPQ